MSLKNFKIWASIFQKIYIYGAQIIDDNGQALMLDKILESIPNPKEFIFCFHPTAPMVTTSTIRNISKLKNLYILRNLRLQKIPEIIPVQDFLDFITNHKNIQFSFEFCQFLSENYKAQLDGFVDVVIASKIPHRIICYSGQDTEKYAIMKDRNRQNTLS